MKQKVYTLAPGHSITPTCTPLDALTLPCWPTIRHHLTTHAAVTEIGTIHRPPPGGFAANFVREILCCPCMLHLKNQITYPPAIKHRGARQLRMRKKKNHQRSARINERSNAFVEWQRYDAAISIILLIVKLIGVHLIMLCILLRSPDEHCEYYYAMEVRIFFSYFIHVHFAFRSDRFLNFVCRRKKWAKVRWSRGSICIPACTRTDRHRDIGMRPHWWNETKKNYRAKWSMGWAGIHTHNAYARSRTIPKTTNKKKTSI